MKKKKSNKTNQKNYGLPVFLIVVVIVIASYFFLTNTNGNTEVASNSALNNNANQYEFTKEGELTFQTPDGKFKSKIDIEIADDMVTRTVGLMYRENLKEDQGMLFIFPNQTIQSFWMKNTILSLDIIFVNKDREIVTIHKSTEPLTEESYRSDEPAIYVVEVNAGYTDRHNINEGDKISWRVI